MNKEQFVQTLNAYLFVNGYARWEPWDINFEWERYQRGRSWSNEFFSMVVVPREPTPELLVSMALRVNHGFGLDDERSREVQISNMRKVHEEIVGAGFYRDDRKEYYRTMLPEPRTLFDAWSEMDDILKPKL